MGVSTYFNENYGRVITNCPAAIEIIDYLLVKDSKPLEFGAPFIQNPSELFPVILIGAVLFELDDVIDDTLIQLDHTQFAFYVPDSFKEFWQDQMDSGRSIVFQLGHGIWSVNDVRRMWRGDLSELVKLAMPEDDPETFLAAYLMSLTLSDHCRYSQFPNCGQLTIPCRKLAIQRHETYWFLSPMQMLNCAPTRSCL